MKQLITLIVLVFLSLNLHALDRKAFENITISYGSSNEDIQIYSLSTKHDIEYEKDAFYLPQYLETSIGYWEGDNNSDLYSFSLTPVFQKSFDHFYIEGGVGATYVSKTQIQNENLGVHFQFVTLLGLGFNYESYDLSYRMMHYSNLVHEHNDGVDYHVVSFGYKF